jgi:hypothetical protein
MDTTISLKLRVLAPVAAAFALSMASGSAFAATTVVTSQSAFLAATTGAVTGDFTGIPLPNAGILPGTSWAGFSSLTVQGVNFNTPNPGGAVNVNSALYYGSGDLAVPYLLNSSYSTGSGVDNILTITLPSAQTAFGLDFGTLFSSTTATFALSNGFSTNVPNAPASASGGGTQFIGFLSTTPFTTITLSVPDLQDWAVQDFAFGTASSAPGPAPGVGLLGLAALLLGGAAVRARGLSSR